MKIGIIGLGNVGAKLAGSPQRNGFELVVRDLDVSAAESLLANGAAWADSPGELAQAVLFLASPASGQVTGAVLPIDAGWSAW